MSNNFGVLIIVFSDSFEFTDLTHHQATSIIEKIQSNSGFIEISPDLHLGDYSIFINKDSIISYQIT